ncbi:ABC transporter permease [Actinophytocola algeriensis]|uniref:ABC-2 type transport system permease protein n=1 Tax=Actinophytocola algeriensis TaxID=1768010 RepID=A0A7W7QDI1_9PSEU|nr:ABC transporter permease [Actinophytocola algeriensis]MBB4911602.1 ABC-2 type transport system permease protein [Actinophytocola algeriensis]MBE1473410.1 ABC-2 type transport system permease protein [Actinophytocola algeriensis]
MTITTTRPAVTAHDRGSTFTGTGALVRFILRRDRVRIPVWLAALTLTTVGTAQSFQDLYGDDTNRAQVAETMSTPAGLAMTGPAHYLGDYTLGAMMSHQMLGFMAIMVGLMSVLAVVRHTRAEEETGRAELVRANVVGRHAHLVAALAVVAATNVVLALLIAAGLGGLGMAGITWSGALLYGAAHAAAGIVFAGVAAVTVQITEHSRGAAGLALAVVGVAYVLRAAGDVGDNGLSWLSPIGWVQATWAFLENRWWPLLLAVALAVGLVLVAFQLSSRRDVGAGLRQPRSGAAAASNALAHPIGFALRLHRGLMFGFGVAMLLLGVTYGSILGEAEDMLAGIDAFQDVIAEIGGATVAESFASMVMVIMAIIASVYVVMAALRPRAEENAGRAEPVLATALSRVRWLGSHLVVVLIGSVVMLLAAGLGIGLSGASSMGDSSMVGKLVGASLAYLPALWVTAGIAVLLVGLVPRAAALAWIVPLYAFLVGYLGQILQFPNWMNNLSPFGHIPQLPVDDLDFVPLLALTALAAALAVGGLLAFREREVNVT